MADKFKSISVAGEDYAEYEALAQQISRELGTKISLAQALKMAVSFFKQHRQTPVAAKGGRR